MSVVLIFAAIAFLMAVAYRGHSVILFAPVARHSDIRLTMNPYTHTELAEKQAAVQSSRDSGSVLGVRQMPQLAQ